MTFLGTFLLIWNFFILTFLVLFKILLRVILCLIHCSFIFVILAIHLLNFLILLGICNVTAATLHFFFYLKHLTTLDSTSSRPVTWLLLLFLFCFILVLFFFLDDTWTLVMMPINWLWFGFWRVWGSVLILSHLFLVPLWRLWQHLLQRNIQMSSQIHKAYWVLWRHIFVFFTVC